MERRKISEIKITGVGKKHICDICEKSMVENYEPIVTMQFGNKQVTLCKDCWKDFVERVKGMDERIRL